MNIMYMISRCSHCTFKSVRPDKVKEHILKIHGVGTPPERRLRITEQVQLHRGIMPSSHIKTKMKPGRKEGQAKGDLQLAEGVSIISLLVPHVILWMWS